MTATPSVRGRALLAVALMIGFYALALGICAALGLLIWFDFEQGRPHGRLILFSAISIGVVLWSLWPRKDRFPDPGVPLRPADQPELWGLVNAVAEAAGQAPPRKLFLVGDVNAFVAERDSRLGFGGERIMGIGLPLLQTLTVPQLRSVIAHEFGHFHGGDTRLGPVVYRTREAIGRTITNLRGANSLLHKPFEWYGTLFLRVSHAVSRAQELAADALSVRLVGLEPVRTSLRRVNEVGPLYDHYLQTHYLPVLNRQVRPPLAGGFARYLAAEPVRRMQVQVGEQAMQAKGRPYDTHPPLGERLAAAERVEERGASRADGPLAITLLRNLDALEVELMTFLTGAPQVRQLPAGDWDEVLAPTLIAKWDGFARACAAKLPELRVADFADQGEALARLALQVDQKIPGPQRKGAGTWMLSALLARALHGAGFLVETGPGEHVVMVRGDDRLNAFELGERLARGELDVAEWRATGDRLGIGDLPLAGPAAVPPEQ